MPVPKYYCDYCDKQFQDTPVARRRHLQGSAHQRAKTLWFDSFKDPGQLQGEIVGKGICTQYMRTGFCRFGNHCKYQHVCSSQNQPSVKAGHVYGISQTNIVVGLGPPQLVPTLPSTADALTERLPASFLNLPPSLRPPPENGYLPLPAIDWG